MSTIFSPSRQTGKHKVTKSSERVVINNAWSISIPKGYSYIANMEETAEDVNGDHYYLQVQKSDDCDFSMSYSSDVSLTVKGNVATIDGYYPTTTEYVEAFKQFAGMLATPVYTRMDKDLLTAYAQFPMFSSYNFFVHAAGTNYIYQGQITFSEDAVDDPERIVKIFVKSIEPVKLEDICDTNHLVRLDSSYSLNFDNGEYIKVDNNFKVPVPDGFHGKTSFNNDNILCFIAQKDFDLDGDINDARIALQVQKVSDSHVDPDNLNNAMNNIMQWFTDQGQPYFLHEKITLRRNKRGLILNSQITNTPCTKNYNYGFVYSDGKLYIVAMVISYDSPISDYPDTKWDAKVITESWLSRIVLKGESVEVPEEKETTTDNARTELNIDVSQVPVADVPDYRKKLINGKKSEQYPVRFFHTFDVGDVPESVRDIVLFHCEDTKPGFRSTTEKIYKKAKQYLDQFDDEIKSEILNGELRDTKPIHALRSFIWTTVEMQGDNKHSINSISTETLKSILTVISSHRLANYKLLTTEPDRFGSKFIDEEEIKLYCFPWNIHHIDLYDRKTFKSLSDGIKHTMDIIDLVDQLDALLPFMDQILPCLSDKYDANIRNAARYIIMGWCVFAIFCRFPFFVMPPRYTFVSMNRIDADKYLDVTLDVTTADQNRYTILDDIVVKMDDHRSTITIPEGVKDIIAADDTYELFKGAEEVVFPKSFEGTIYQPDYIRKMTINSNAETITTDYLPYGNGNKLSELYFKGHNKEIYGNYGWGNLQRIVLPQSLEKITNGMFSGCKRLTEIDLPDSIKTICERAFQNSGIRDFTLPAGVESIGEDAFDDQQSDFTIRVYKDTKSETALRRYCNGQNAKYEADNRRLGSHYYAIKMHVVKLDAPWISKAKDFVRRIEGLYDTPEDPVKIKELIKSWIDSSFDAEFNYAKETALTEGEYKSLTTLCRVLKESDDMSMLKEKLPDILAAEIPAEAKRRAYEKKHAELTEEIKSNKYKIETLEKSIAVNSDNTSALQSKLNEKEQDLQKKKDQYDALIEEKKKNWTALSTELQKEISDSKQYLQNLLERKKTKLAELNGLSFLQFGKKKELTQIIEGLGKEIENEQLNQDRLADKYNKANQEYHAAVDGPQNELYSITEEVQELKTSIDQLLNQVLKDKQELEEKKNRLPELNKELEELESGNN